MLYGIYNRDDPKFEDGQILQSNKIWHSTDADKKFEDGILDLGQRFVKAETPYVRSPDLWFADTHLENWRERPPMQVEQSKQHMKAGTDDHVLLAGIPRGAKFRIMAGATEYMTGQLDPDGTEIDLSVPVPCTCKVILDKWPYQTFTATVEVHA